ncbi:MAG: hypothetical protein GX684_01965 [Ruminococcaceae bacterium]|nr:hypothetical protein [Oscillospiraceae bacterium]
MDKSIKNAFEKITAEDSLKRNTMAFLKENAYSKKEPARTRKRSLVLALAGLILIVFVAGGFGMYFTPVSAISVDVNPSFELGVNLFDKVISVKNQNPEDKSVSVPGGIKYKDYAQALDTLLASEELSAYIKDDAVISVTAVGSSEKAGKQMLGKISACNFAQRQGAICSYESREEAKTAKDLGISLGKYRMYLLLLKLDAEITPEAANNMTMRELKDLIYKLSEEKGVEAPNLGQGTGYRGGK